MYKVHEIFNSVQGEGKMAGMHTTFVRFTGCNAKCSFCDTNVNKMFAEYTEEQLMSEIRAVMHMVDVPPAYLVFTGGEPTLQLTMNLVKKVKNLYEFVGIETNGSRMIDPLGCIDHVTISPKPGVDIDTGWYGRHVEEVRILVDAGGPIVGTPAGLMDYTTQIFFSPMFDEDGKLNKEALAKALECVEIVPKSRLSIQLHKLIGVR